MVIWGRDDQMIHMRRNTSSGLLMRNTFPPLLMSVTMSLVFPVFASHAVPSVSTLSTLLFQLIIKLTFALNRLMNNSKCDCCNTLKVDSAGLTVQEGLSSFRLVSVARAPSLISKDKETV